jgi:hypothetical protein
MAESFHVQQALFGYREGHNLLASSISLSPQARHFLATITDSSGTESSDGFDCGYTGVPVPDTDYYALFCTWLAPEMPRPGCVWSHVLLVELTDLARISNLSVLWKLYRRPTIPAQLGFSDYLQELTLEQTLDTGVFTKSIDRHRASVLLNALYEQPESGVVVLDQECSPWEEIVFDIWSQQWPRLRRNFAFSTSSLGDRRLAGVSFDLQIAPAKSDRLWRRKGLPTLVVDMMSENSQVALEQSWINVVLADLEHHGASELRNFFFAYASDIEKPRRAFPLLVKAYTSLSTNLDWGERLRSIGTIFPNESEALRLKEMLVTPNNPAKLDREWSTAAFLLGSPEAKAYAKVPFDHVGLAPNLWNDKREDVLALIARLVRQDEHPSSRAFANAIGKCVAPNDLHSIAQRHPELIPVFISQRTELAHEVGTWELPGYVQSQIFEVLEGLSLSQEEWGGIMEAMFVAATFVSVNSAVRNSGSYAMPGAFRWLNHEISKRLLPSPEWRHALIEAAANELAGGKTLSPSQLALCSWIVPPEAVRYWLSTSRTDLLELASKSLDELPKPLRSYTAFVLVTVGLRSKTLDGVKLIKRGYFQVHEVLANGQATSDEWALLGPELPRIGWNEWDRCEKLRRAARKWLSNYWKNGNPLMEAASTTRESEIAREILN